MQFKVGDVLRIVKGFAVDFIKDSSHATLRFEPGHLFTVTAIVDDTLCVEATLSSSLHSFAATLKWPVGAIKDGAVEVLRTVTLAQPPEVKPPMSTERPSASFRLSFYGALQNRNRPSANLFQMVASKLAEVKQRPDWVLTPDGVFGKGTDAVARSIQTAYGLSPVDGEVGKGTWRAITPDLGSWRPPFRFRMMECQCTWEAGKSTYGYYGLIKREGWWNYGVYNTNKGSAKTLVSLGGASHLRALIDQADAMGSADNPYGGQAVAAQVGDWFGSKAGRETQVGIYCIQQVLQPSLKNLNTLGWDMTKFGFASIDECLAITDPDEMDAKLATMDTFHERLLLQACDITINSGPGGYFPQKSPRAWGGHGDEAWPVAKLPFKEEAKKIYAETFGGAIPDDYTYLTSDTRMTYRDALKRCLDELCQTDEQRIALIAELQARCVIDAWRGDVIRRRRAVAWPEGHSFQGSFYCMSEHFGVGV